MALIDNMNKKRTAAVLKPADLNMIERVIYRNRDDVAVAVNRWFERLEAQVEAAERRIFERLNQMETELKSELFTLRLYVEDSSEVFIGEK